MNVFAGMQAGVQAPVAHQQEESDEDEDMSEEAEENEQIEEDNEDDQSNSVQPKKACKVRNSNKAAQSSKNPTIGTKRNQTESRAARNIG